MASFKFNNVYIKDAVSIAGPKEVDGKIRKFNLTMDDYYYKEKTLLSSEVKMQKDVIDNLLYKNKITKIDLLIGGDLQDQITITNNCAKYFDIPFLGIYNACATFAEGLIIASNFIESKQIKNAIVITSSHNLNAERQFRFPVEYGAPKKMSATITTTGAVASLLTKEKSKIKIESATIGNVVDYDIKDANNMGAVMAPAARVTLLKHLNDLEREANYYDLILTGDLGVVGSNIFHEILKMDSIQVKNHLDAGCEIYLDSQEINAGGSGPVCLPLVLFNKILKSNKYKKILIIATGSLHSKDTTNQHQNIPAIAHAVSLEVLS